MKTLLTLLMMVSVAYGQTKTAPPQGPPPKNLTQKADGHFTANNDPANPEKFEVYTVKAGDTLSMIAGTALKNPRLWPQLWEQNEHIVNPHWIYPNDKVLIKPVIQITEATPPPPTPEPVAPPPPPPSAPTERPRPTLPPVSRIAPPPTPVGPDLIDLTPRRAAPEIKAADMYCSGFVRKTELPANLKISAKQNADGGALAATTTDYIYVSQGAEDGVRAGTMYQVVRPTRKIESLNEVSKAQRDLGMHYLDVAQIQVVMAHPDFSLARVVSSCEAIEIGDLLMPYRRMDAPILPRPRVFSPFMAASGAMQGSIVMTRNVLMNFGSAFHASGKIAGSRSRELATVEKGMAGTSEIVYLDLGTASGAKSGDIFIVYRHVEVDSKLYDSTDAAKRVSMQKTAIGEVVILKVEEGASTAIVTYASTGLSVGDSVERR